MNKQKQDNMRVEAKELVRKMRLEFKIMQQGDRNATRQSYGRNSKATPEGSISQSIGGEAGGSAAQAPVGTAGADGGATP
jgi:hypothetical protein